MAKALRSDSGERSGPPAVLPCSLQPPTDYRALVRASSEEARRRLPYAVALRYSVLPLAIVEGLSLESLAVVSTTELSAPVLQELRFITGAELVVESAAPELVLPAIHAAYRASPDGLIHTAVAAADSLCREESPASPLRLDTPVPMLLDAVVRRADYLDASDLHLQFEASGVTLKFRIDGRLRPERSFSVPHQVGRHLLRCLLVRCGLDSTGDGALQEGACVWTIEQRTLTLRLSTMPDRFGPKAVVRILKSDAVGPAVESGAGRGVAFRDLGLGFREERLFRAALCLQSGVILTSGPTGSGKSTLLHTALRWLNDGALNIISIEDPVERPLHGVHQIELDRGSGESFATLFKRALRQDPDVVMVGEIRDTEVAKLVCTAALAGHLILSTVHAGSAPEALSRLFYMGVPADLIATTVRLAVCQRLVPFLCEDCAYTAPYTPALGELLFLDHGVPLRSAAGCELCGYTGRRGRTGVYEALAISADVRRVVYAAANGAPWTEEEILRRAAAEGFLPFRFQVRELLLEGRISAYDALHCLGAPRELGGCAPGAC